MKLEGNLSKEVLVRKHKSLDKNININSWINVIVMFCILICFFISSFFISNGGISENEKRNLATFPSIKKSSSEDVLSGEYFKKIEEFYNDNFPLRDEFLKIASKLDELKGNKKDEIKIY